MAALPLIGIVGGCCWPYLVLLPVTAAPIAGKTLRQASYRSELLSPVVGWTFLVAVPLGIMLYAAISSIARNTLARRRSTSSPSARVSSPPILLLCTWFYFGLNTVFFEFAWPWADSWTFRTLNQLIFIIGTLVLTAAAIVFARHGRTAT